MSKTWRSGREERRTQRQLIDRLRDSSGEELDDRLAALGKEFPGSFVQALRILCHERGWALSEAGSHMKSFGFHTASLMYFNHQAFHSALTKLSPACFEAALSVWEKLDSKAQEWLSTRLVLYWGSPGGARLTAEWLTRTKAIWELVPPPMAKKLGAERACGLGWPQRETEALLSTHVDLQGDACGLVRELLEREMLSPSLLEHQGIVAALLKVDQRRAVQKLLAGEISLEKPQATLARAFVTALADWEQEFTVQNSRHLLLFVQKMSSDLAKATNATYQMMDSLMALAPKLQQSEQVTDRQRFLSSVASLYLDPGGMSGKATSRTAEIAHPDAGREPAAQRRCLRVSSFKAFVERAIRVLSLADFSAVPSPAALCSSAVRELAEDDCFRERFHAWALEQLGTKQTSEQILLLLQHWVCYVCSPGQVLSFWLRAVDAIGSWSFVLASLSPVAEASGNDERIYDMVAGLLAREPHAGQDRCARVLRPLAHVWPARFVERRGIKEFLDIEKLPGPYPAKLVPRCTNELSSGALQINDHLQPDVELRRVLDKQPTLHKTKTKEEWACVVDWVQGLDARVFCDTEVSDRLSQILCEKWSDKVQLQSLCAIFATKQLECLPVIRDPSALLKFVAKCPNLGAKHEFLARQLEGRVAARGAVELALLHPLLSAVALNVRQLVDLLHALKCSSVTGETRRLFFDLLRLEKSGEQQVCWLGEVRFSLPPEGVASDECVDCDLWDQVETWAHAEQHDAKSGAASSVRAAVGGSPSQAEAEEDGATLVETLLAEPPGLRRDALFARFGLEGETVVRDFIEAAAPKQICDTFLSRPSFLALCRAEVGAWSPAECPADQVGAMLEVLERVPELYSRAAPLVWKAGSEADVKRLLAMTWKVGEEQVRLQPDLDSLPTERWRCVHWPSAKDDVVARALRAGVAVPVREAAFASRGWETQALLLEAHGEDIEVLADVAPMALGPLEACLERFFELLPLRAEELKQLGDGIEEEERLLSGWNKMVHRLLLAVRERIKDGNPLHTSEQLLLFKGCTARKCDSTNSTLLADLMETKMIDPLHIFSVVSFVLNTKSFSHTVHDSALRAMMRLPKDDRDALHRALLESAGHQGLPLQTLFSLVVTQLDDGVLPLVRAQLARLTMEEWSALLVLIKDANPTGGKDPHTYPRSLAPEFGERFLLRYLVDDGPKRDPRFFRLFAACTPAAAIPRYLLGALMAQRHMLDDLFLDALTEMTMEEFRELVEFLPPKEWSSRIDWVLNAAAKAEDAASDRLAAVLDVILHPTFAGWRCALLNQVLGSPRVLGLLADAKVRGLLRERLPSASCGKAERALLILFFRQSWLAGARCTAEELATALGIGAKHPLSKAEVQQLGVDAAACKRLVQLAPEHALPEFGFAILEEEPAFAASLCDESLQKIQRLSAARDSDWATCRRVVAEVQPVSALRIAICLFRNSRETRDLDLVASAYRSVDSFTRKQTWMPTELTGLWKKFGDQIQQKVIDPEVPPEHTVSLEVSRVQTMSRQPSTSSWTMVSESGEWSPPSDPLLSMVGC